MNKKIIIVGSSGHAKVIAEILEDHQYEIVGYLDSFAPAGQRVGNYRILGNEQLLATAQEQFGTTQVVVAVGENNGRFAVVQKVLSLNKNLEFPPIIAPSARVAHSARVGRGSVVLTNAVINSDSRIGEFVVVNTAAVVEHDSVIHDFAGLASGAVLGGNVEIGQKAFIGLGARVIQKRTIGAASIIGAGSAVVDNIPDMVLAVGSPAKVIKTNYFNDKIFV